MTESEILEEVAALQASIRDCAETMRRIESLQRMQADTLMELLQYFREHGDREEAKMAQFEAHLLLMRNEVNVVHAQYLAAFGKGEGGP